MELKQKILCCGDVEGKFNALFKRVNKIVKSSGNFDMLLCVGNFFGINNTEFEAYKTGEIKVPLPVYILGPNKEEHASLYPISDVEICPNIFYIGKRGIFSTSKGVKIAYISGIANKTESEFTYTEKDITELFDVCIRGNSAFRGVDILLTSQWPKSIIADTNKITLKPQYDSDLPSWIIMKLKPRYVISGLEGFYYERPPFRSPLLSDHDSTVELVTRFIGLARVDNAKKEKWIYALNVMPLEKMKVSELMQKTTDETGCPFDFDDLQSKIFQIQKKVFATQQYFYNMDPVDDEPQKKKRKGKIVFDQSKCWFCLASPSVEKHLIITVGEHSYLALAKGGLTEEHFLICPIEHYQSSLNQTEEIKNEIQKFKDSLVQFYRKKNKVPIFFERNYKTSHMQIQVVPIPKEATKELMEIFKEEAEGHGFALNDLDSDTKITQVLQVGLPFFVVELPNGDVLYTQIKGSSHFPLNFGRDVICTGPILNLPDRVEWKDCILSKEKEVELVQKIRNEFEPFDFNQ